MDDNFKCFFKILKSLEMALDLDEFDINSISYERLKITENRWLHYMEMLSDEGYIKGVKIVHYANGGMGITYNNISITLKGLEYLSENGIMRRIYKKVMNAKNLIS